MIVDEKVKFGSRVGATVAFYTLARVLLVSFFILLILISFFPTSSFACSGKVYKTDAQLISDSPVIYIGKITKAERTKSGDISRMFDRYDYIVHVENILKGKLKKKSVELKKFGKPGSDNGERDGSNCSFDGGFEVGKEYIIFTGTMDSRGFRRLETNSAWLQKIKDSVPKE